MEQSLLWIELLVASCLMVAVALVDGARSKRVWFRWFIMVSGVLIPLACWTTVTYLACWLRMVARVGPPAKPWFIAVLAGVFVIITSIVLRRGLPNRRAASWPAWKLNLVFGAVCILSFMTFWNLDLNARNQLGHLQARASSIINAIFPPSIPDAQNAAHVYEQAFDSLEITSEKQIIPWSNTIGEWLDPPHRTGATSRPGDEQIRKILKDYSRGLNQLRKAAQMEQCNFVGYCDRIDLLKVLLGQVTNVRTAGEILAADARMRAMDGDLAGAVADINALFSMSEHITREPTMITALNAIALEGRAVRTLEIILAENRVTAADLASLNINPLFSHGRTVRLAFLGQEAFGLTTLASLGDPGYQPLPRRYLPGILIPMYRVFLMNDEIQSHNIATREWQRLAMMPYHKSAEQWETLSTRLTGKQTGFIISRMLSATSRYPSRAAEGDAKHRLAILAVAVTKYRLKTGSLPENLEQLTPEFIEMIPTDPFTGKPMRMIRTKDGQARLYSLGPNRKDDESRMLNNAERTGDVVFRLISGK